MESVISEYDKILISTHFESLKIGLTNLLQKVKIKPEDTLVEIDYKLNVKIEAAKLVLAIKRHFKKKIKIFLIISLIGKNIV